MAKRGTLPIFHAPLMFFGGRPAFRGGTVRPSRFSTIRSIRGTHPLCLLQPTETACDSPGGRGKQGRGASRSCCTRSACEGVKKRLSVCAAAPCAAVASRRNEYRRSWDGSVSGTASKCVPDAARSGIRATRRWMWRTRHVRPGCVGRSRVWAPERRFRKSPGTWPNWRASHYCPSRKLVLICRSA